MTTTTPTTRPTPPNPEETSVSAPTTAQTFTLENLMDLLVDKVGLPVASRTQDPAKTFTDVGLDSLAYLQLQTELEEFGVSPDDSAPEHDHTLGDLVSLVNDAQHGQQGEQG